MAASPLDLRQDLPLRNERPPLEPPPGAPAPKEAMPLAGEARMGALRSAAALLREHGVDPLRILAECGLPPSAFEEPDLSIPFRAAACLVQRGAWAVQRPDFGLLMGQRLDFADLGLLGLLVQRAPTVGDALDRLVRFFHLEDRGSVAYLSRPEPRLAALGYAVYDADTPGLGMFYDMVMAMAMTILRALCGPAFRAAEVHLAHTAPTDLAPYRRCFRAPIVFDAPHSEVHFEVRWLAAANAGADAIGKALAQGVAREFAHKTDRSLTETVRGVVRTLLMRGSLSGPGVAAALGLHERTLRRRLVAEGASLLELIAEARFDVARQLLQETRLPLANIADALGYAEASNFVRAFRGWAGCTPGRWRGEYASSATAPASVRR